MQKHAASHLHYDFRLELGGVLKSWSIPKGPSLDPAVKRLAMATEDHPLDYADFEGIIPQGQYGGGTVLVWDRGYWIPEGNPHQSYHAGRLRFELVGEKLGGTYELVRGAGSQDRSGKNWLLRKCEDLHGRSGARTSITDDSPESVLTGRTLEQIAQDRDRVWHSNRGKKANRPQHAPGARPYLRTLAAGLSGSRRAKRSVRAQLVVPTAVRRPPLGEQWLHEIAHHGRRVLAPIERGRARLFGDSGEQLLHVDCVLEKLQSLGTEHAVLDGYLVAVGLDGQSDREALEAILSGTPSGKSAANLCFFAIDLIALEGYDLGGVELVERQRALRVLLPTQEASETIRHNLALLGQGREFFEEGCRLGVGAILSRRADSSYPPRAAREWRISHCPARSGTLRMSERAETVEARRPVVAGIAISNPDRVLYPEVDLTKLELARYYERISSHMLPHVVGRPLTLVRADVDVTKGTHYMRHAKAWGPPELRRARIREKHKTGEYLIVEDERGLVALAQMSIVEIHTWNSTIDAVERPNRLVFDLDPGPQIEWPKVVAAARLLRRTLKDLGLTSFVKTTGGTGLHLVVPIEPTSDWATCLAFSRAIATAIARADPRRHTISLPKSGRVAKIFIDYLRNNRTNTSVAAFSTRARPNAPVSVPLSWDELEDSKSSDEYDVTNVDQRLTNLNEDPWRDYFECRQELPRFT
jgi:bifunctional non-homologous end joining protein LigD